MDFSRLNPKRTVFGGAMSLLLVVSLLFFPWYSLTDVPERDVAPDRHYICGVGELTCTGWEVFPVLRWLLLLVALAPPILAWILIRGHKLTWAPGELTMVAGFAAAILIAYNGIIDRPEETFGLGLDYGYWLALLAALGIAATGFSRALESGAGQGRKTPGTV
jgi:hypothetical protein